MMTYLNEHEQVWPRLSFFSTPGKFKLKVNVVLQNYPYPRAISLKSCI